MFDKILIANRGEIACRIIRTAKRLGIKTVAVFSEADANALHVTLADEAYLLGSAASKDSYLNIDKIIALAKKTKVAAIHPGYGFLSENADFANAVAKAKLVFIGPTADVIRLMGNKKIAKDVIKKNGIPVLHGFYDEQQSVDNLLLAAQEIGFPIVLKAVAGGGGKGLRLVTEEHDFKSAYNAVKREAKAFFNDDKVLLEKYLLNAKHIEVQIMADHHGNISALFTRDCSIQRRHQKIIEEAPAPTLSANLEQKIMAAATDVARAIQYTNAGTVEFLVAEEHFYFMEMNTRLQVEHPVTEMITHLDLVEWQLRIAAGERLFKNAVEQQGHAIEVRLNAEDPENNFLPSAGTLHYFDYPKAVEFLRVDSGYQTGDTVNIFYDSLIAKFIVWAETRAMAIQRLVRVLDHTLIFGIKSNLSLLKAILQNDNFKNKKFDTHFLQTESISLRSQILGEFLVLSGLLLLVLNQQANHKKCNSDSHSLWLHHDGWRLFSSAELAFHFTHQQQDYVVNIKQGADGYTATIGDQTIKAMPIAFKVIQDNVYQLGAIVDEQYLKPHFYITDAKLEMVVNGQYYSLGILREDILKDSFENLEQILAPMPGTLVALHVDIGQKVSKGEKLLVIEAMKMEHTVYAPKDGIIKTCHYRIGDSIKEGSELIEFE